jgi:hypothetical protein
MSELLIHTKKDFIDLGIDAMWTEYKALAKAYRVLTSKYEQSIDIKGNLRNKVIHKSEVIARYENNLSTYREQQAASGSRAHSRTNEFTENALIFWQANMADGDELSHKRFQRMHRDACSESNLSDETYRKLKTAANKAWKLFPNDVIMYVKAAKFFRNKPRGTFPQD